MAGKRYSRQRELIYEAVKGSNAHPTAEMVYQWLKPENPNLSLGTVYRNLNLLAQEGMLRRMPFPIERYDACTEPHSHLRCEECCRVMDLILDYDAAMDALAAQTHPGIQITHHDLTFYGLCPACRDKQMKSAG
ncbi:MAG: transcriptional repressor [Oscillospiraceae bacterium]|nr:transcriptional repressor [Oscillospiraceae bacterium]